ncbi:hypothetical protein BABINDRAFT_49119 [Babjeviella inositovora NRRL Y-12698]|uniref:Aminopeptidase n=1 Tax=Babjeviella inositovora NRRL Y-12698 TaxID=984486 RepID=A0A1E3QRR2_9ASCO|nr:uncharacterized protein BABINDRAFT_49119 [Babjeviella inositovora NRRL Y-12698]ODQ79732.1 hypothetical protein BABINDRAFT_49119 [Babjeviella inositovora NRRL Y-12698]
MKYIAPRSLGLSLTRARFSTLCATLPGGLTPSGRGTQTSWLSGKLKLDINTPSPTFSSLTTHSFSSLQHRYYCQMCRHATTGGSSTMYVSTFCRNETNTGSKNASQNRSKRHRDSNCSPKRANSYRGNCMLFFLWPFLVFPQWTLAGNSTQLILSVPSDRQVLPTNVKPTKYDVTMEPNFSTFKFDGSIKIDLDVKEDTHTVTVNSLEIEIHSAKIAGQDAASTTFDEDKQSATFTFAEELKAGTTAQLELTFTGVLNDKMAGFYRSTYQENGETKYLATTQMEPTDCRRAFPCFDEPALKAVFDITLISDEKLTCLSNMDVKSEKKLAGGKKAVSFNSTPLMSTYLVAFVIGELNYIETDAYRVPIRVYTTPGLEEQGRFSLDLAAKTLAFFDKTFGIDYPLPKMDMIAIHDFSAGAMENWGLVTYRVVDLLLDPKTSSLSTQQRVAEVVQHELAHQWFGNLVTMDWWEGLWLNEGFATWMSWYSCNQFYPDWKVWEQYVTDSLQSALSLDALRASHPIEVPVKRADEINQIFDAISYAKGSSLLKMISRWLGEEVFIKGVANYLKKHKYSNTQTGDLWKALSEASGKDVVKVMDVWTKKIGYPVVSVTEKDNELTVKQNRYLTTGDVKPEEDETIYPVFLGLRTAAGIDESVVLDSREKTLTLDDASFFKINGDQAGVYRTNYTPERWVKLGEAGRQGLLSVEDRAGLVADAGALCVSGYSSTTNLLSLVSGWKQEQSFVVWDEIITRITSLRAAFLFEDVETRDALKALTRALISEKAHVLGWEFKETDGFLEQQLKALVFAAAVGAKDEELVAVAQDLFQKYVAGDKSAVHPNIRASVFSTVAATGGAEEYDQIYHIYHNAISVDEKITALRTLGRFEQPELIQKTLNILLDSSIVKAQDVYIPMQGLRSHSAGIEALWTWMQANWDEIYKLLPPGLSMLGSVVQICTSGFSSEEKKEEIRAYFATKSTKGFDQGLTQSLDSIQSKANWIKRDSASIKEWLTTNGYKK